MAATKSAGEFFARFTEFGDAVLITNDFGKFQVLDKAVFQAVANGGAADAETMRRLDHDLFFLGNSNLGKAAETYHKRHKYLREGPSLFALVFDRCEDPDSDAASATMTVSIARKALDIAFSSSSTSLDIEFRAAEPLRHPELLKFAMDYARERAADTKKALRLHLYSAFPEDLTEAVQDDLQGSDLVLQPLLDAAVLTGDPSAETNPALQVLGRVRALANGAGEQKPAIEPVLFFGAGSLPKAADLVARLSQAGISKFNVQAFSPEVFASVSLGLSGPEAADFTAFYVDLLGELINAGKKGLNIQETSASALARLAFEESPATYQYVRNPGGDGLGHLSFSPEGNVYVSEAGRALHDLAEDDEFLLGSLDRNSLEDLLDQDVVRALAIATCLEGQGECSQCAFYPYCGLSGSLNYVMQGDIHGQTRTNTWCHRLKAFWRAVFSKLVENDEAGIKVLRAWK